VAKVRPHRHRGEQRGNFATSSWSIWSQPRSTWCSTFTLRGRISCFRRRPRQFQIQNSGGRIIKPHPLSGLLATGRATTPPPRPASTGLTRTVSMELATMNVTVNAIRARRATRMNEDIRTWSKGMGEKLAPSASRRWCSTSPARKKPSRVTRPHLRMPAGRFSKYLMEQEPGLWIQEGGVVAESPGPFKKSPRPEILRSRASLSPASTPYVICG